MSCLALLRVENPEQVGEVQRDAQHQGGGGKGGGDHVQGVGARIRDGFGG